MRDYSSKAWQAKKPSSNKAALFMLIVWFLFCFIFSIGASI